MIIEKTSLNGVLLIKPKVHGDERGYFLESYRKSTFQEMGLTVTFVQDNQAFSTKNCLRGLHYQLNYPQGKLVKVAQGVVLDVAVDISRGSPTFGKYFAAELSDKNHQMMYIPEGFAHGYSVLSETALFQYKCTEYYHPEDEYGVKWDDPIIGIDWKVSKPNLSNKDDNLLLLKDINKNYLPLYRGKNE